MTPSTSNDPYTQWLDAAVQMDGEPTGGSARGITLAVLAVVALSALSLLI